MTIVIAERLPYRGRFAPSPTGPLHFGSLVAAVGSYLRAKSRSGEWYLRIENIDPPREVAGASDDQIRCLETLGFEWDGAVYFQSESAARFEQALANLTLAGHTFQCRCPRKLLRQTPPPVANMPRIYPGTCRDLGLPDTKSTSTRLKVESGQIEFTDILQGRISQRVADEVGDFVLRRRDSLFAYQLAVVVDDADQGITEIVRGCDLLDNTMRQIYLQRLLGYPTPDYVHLPVATTADNDKLSKHTGALAIDNSRPARVLVQALSFLRQHPPAGLVEADPSTVWAWALENWDISKLSRIKSSIAVSN